jgi:hypothetical protein
VWFVGERGSEVGGVVGWAVGGGGVGVTGGRRESLLVEVLVEEQLEWGVWLGWEKRRRRIGTMEEVAVRRKV